MIEMHAVLMVAAMIAVGAAISAYVAQRGDAAAVPVRIKRHRR